MLALNKNDSYPYFFNAQYQTIIFHPTTIPLVFSDQDSIHSWAP